MDQQDRQRLEEVQEVTSTLGWRYIQEELSTQIENIKEAMLYVDSELELGRMQGRAEQAAVLFNLGTEVGHLLEQEEDEARAPV